MSNIFPDTVSGAIFDVDDTLLDNQAGVEFGTLHELTRLKAIHEVALSYNLPTLATLTEQENLDAFLNASTHSLDGAVWEALYLKKVVDAKDLDPNNKLLSEIVQLKNSLHADTLRQLGREVLDASEFVRTLPMPTVFEILWQLPVLPFAGILGFFLMSLRTFENSFRRNELLLLRIFRSAWESLTQRLLTEHSVVYTFRKKSEAM